MAEQPSIDRRRVLLALGFGAANLGVLSQLAPLERIPAASGLDRRDSAGEGDDAAPTNPGAVEGAPDEPPADHVYEQVIGGGRVIDPASGFDGVANVGIDDGVITRVSTQPLVSGDTIDASGLVVAPGFIDILSYDPNPYGIDFKVADGVTTNLGMHGLNAVAEQWFARWEAEGSLTHFGGAFDNPYARSQLGVDVQDRATTAQIDALVAQVERGIDDGWIGIDFEPEYTPGVEPDEINALAEVAAERDVPCFFHARYSDPDPPGTNRQALEEIVAVAEATGAAVHVEHITSTGGTHTMADSIAYIEEARAAGLRVTACMYPYDYWATYLGSERFAGDWAERFRISYDDLAIAGTGERLTATSFEKYRSENLLAAAFAIPEDDVVAGLKVPWIMLGSDAILEPSNNNHPRSTGCFTRTLGRYVREQGVLSLSEALAKMTILPARLLEGAAPGLTRKGRVQRGADADLCVFDPAAVSDRSTLENPAQMAVGIDWVLVDGNRVKTPDGVDNAVRAGRAVRYGA